VSTPPSSTPAAAPKPPTAPHTPSPLHESRDAAVRTFDLPGALLVMAGLSSLVYAITQTGTYGWTSGRTIGVGGAALALLAAFVWWERRHTEPLMRFGLLRTRRSQAPMSAP
jgi:hypothetical protein